MAPPEDPGCVASPFPFPARGGRVRLECWEDEGELTWFRSILHFWVQPPPREGLPTKTGFVADDGGANFVNTYSAATRLETEPADRFLAHKGKGKKEREKATTSVTNGKTTERGNRGTNKLCTLKPARRQSQAKNSRTRRTFRGCAGSVVADDTSRLELFEPPPPTTPIFGEQPAAEEHFSYPFASSPSSVENQQPPSDTLSGNYSRQELSSSHSTSLVRGSKFAANLSQGKFCRRRSLWRECTVDKYCSVRVTESWNSEVATTGKNSDEGDRKRCPQSIKRGGQCVAASHCDCAAVLPVSGGGRPSLADGAVIAVTRQSTALTSHSTVTGRATPPPTTVKREATGNRLDTQPALTGVQALSHTGRKFSKTTGRVNRAVSTSNSLRFKADGLRHTSANSDRYHDSGRGGSHWCAFNAGGTAAAASSSSDGTVVSLRPDSVSVLIKEIGKDVDLGLRFSSAQCTPVVVIISDHVSSFSKADKEIERDVDLGRLPTDARLTAVPLENTAISTAARFSGKGLEKNIDSGILSVERSRGLTHHATPTPPPARQRFTGDPAVVTGTQFESFSAQSMIPVAVSESVAVVTVPRYAERSVESAVHFKDMRRHKSSVSFEPTLAPVRFADTMVVYGKDSTKKRYISRTFYEPRVKPRRFAETDFLFPKDTTQRFASFLDYHIDECRRWFKTCLELKARTFTTVHTFPGSSSSVSSQRVATPGSRRDVTVDGATDDDVGYDGPGASQVFIPPYKVGEKELGERRFRVPLRKAKVDINMNGPLTNGF